MNSIKISEKVININKINNLIKINKNEKNCPKEYFPKHLISIYTCGNNKKISYQLTHYNTLKILNSKWKFNQFNNLKLKIIHHHLHNICKSPNNSFKIQILTLRFFIFFLIAFLYSYFKKN